MRRQWLISTRVKDNNSIIFKHSLPCGSKYYMWSSHCDVSITFKLKYSFYFLRKIWLHNNNTIVFGTKCFFFFTMQQILLSSSHRRPALTFWHIEKVVKLVELDFDLNEITDIWFIMSPLFFKDICLNWLLVWGNGFNNFDAGQLSSYMKPPISVQ